MKWLWGHIKDTLRLFSVQVNLAWGGIWMWYGSQSPDVISELAQHKVGWFSITAWMGILQGLSTIIARKIAQTPKS